MDGEGRADDGRLRVNGSALGILLEIAAAAALLLWAVRLVRTGMTRALGAQFRSLVARAAASRLRAALTGAFVTLALQSATATTLLVASLAGRGLIATAPAVAVVLGADVGSTLAVQVFSLGLQQLAPLPVLLGVVLYLRHDGGLWRHLGRVLVGLGLVLLALRWLAGATAPLKQSQGVQLVMAAVAADPALALLLAAGVTWLLHSSLAAVLLFAAFARHGPLDNATALAFILGANLGAGLPALTLTARSHPAARRAVVANLALRGLLAVLLLGTLADIAPYLAALTADPGLRLVHFHTLFNLLVAAVGLVLLTPLARLLERLLPAPPERADEAAPRYLDPEAVEVPRVALAAAAREALRMGDVAREMLARSLEALAHNDLDLVRRIRLRDDVLDRLHEAVKFYLMKISRQELDEEESRRYQEILVFITNMEHIGDIVDLNLMETAEKKARENLSFSPQGFAELRAMHQQVLEHFDLALAIFTNRDVELARRLVAAKAEIRELERRAWTSHLRRLQAGVPDTVQTTALHLDVIRDLKRINGHITAIAYPILEEARARGRPGAPAQEARRPEAEAPEPAGGAAE